MNYEEAMEYIREVGQYGSVLGLDNTKELLRRLGNPQNDLKFVHIAGTNGKGSTGAYIGTILAKSGYLVGRYISPVIFEYCERIQQMKEDRIQSITKEEVSEILWNIRKVIGEMLADGFVHPTVFEVETAMAFLYFRKIQCDIVILEVGMGGRLDSTNVIETPVLCIMTSISMDHMQFLGDTIEKIAFEKAGIIKDNIRVVSYEQMKEVRDVILEVCAKHHSECSFMSMDGIKNVVHSFEGITFDYKNYEKLFISLLGENQVKNAALAIEAVMILQKLGYDIPEEAMKQGLRATQWPGRFSLLHKSPYVFVDGAHNMDAAISLRKSMELYFTNRKIIYIMGVLADKDYRGILQVTASFADTIITITPDNPRALASEQLQKVAGEYHPRVVDGKVASNAMAMAFELAGPEDVILAFGSLSFLGEIYQYFEAR